MIDWAASMQQTYEYYKINPNTWKDEVQLDEIISSSIERDSSKDTLGSATIECTESLDECYIRVYLIAIQGGEKEKRPLGTFIIQTPSEEFDGLIKKYSIDAYTPLLELKDISPPLGYSIPKGTNILETVYGICSELLRAPVVSTNSDKVLNNNFIATIDESWFDFLTSLLNQANYEFQLDELGRILFAPIQNASFLRPVWTFNDDNSSILSPEISINRDLYGIPNVVEVVYSTDEGCLFSRVENNDENSPISIPSRGREVLHRVTDINLPGTPTQEILDAYAEELLSNLSSLEYEVDYKHGYCPVRIGDAVYLNYTRAKLNNIKAKVIRQSIDCKSGCIVDETAVYTINLWRGNK